MQVPPSKQTLRLGLVAAVVVFGAVMAYWRWHRTATPSDAVAPSHTQVESVREGAPEGDPVRPPPIELAQRAPATPTLPSDDLPALPALPNGSAATTPAEVFSVETRDTAWAAAIEAEIHDRMTKAPAKLKTECRSSRCQLTLDGESDAVGKTIAMFESEQGLIGFAENIYLTKPEIHDDGTTTLHAIATFAR